MDSLSKETVILSRAPNPAPVKVTEVPGGPEVLFKVTFLVVLNVAVASSVMTDPVAVMGWEPYLEAGIVITVLKVPPVTVAMS